MPADRFYFDGALGQGASIALEDPEHHHLSRVMRIGVGDKVEVVNGQGSLARGVVASIEKRSTSIKVVEVLSEMRGKEQIILAIPLMRANKLEWILEKGTELGADGFWLYAADHSEKSDLSVNQMERMRNLTISALKQSGRLFLPHIEILASIEKVFCGTVLYGDTRPEAPSLLAAKGGELTIFVTGPERGFTEKEVALLEKRATGVTLSPYILRAETAPLAAMAILGIRLKL